MANPPADVRDLFETLRRTTLAVPRDERIIGTVTDVLDALADEVRRDYLGRGLPEVVAAERRRAELDVGFLSDALARGRNHVPFLLRAVQVTPADVRRACRTAAAEIAADDPGQVGLLSFEDFYRVLASDFAAGLKERLGRPDALTGGRVDPAAAQDTVKSIRSRFAAIPQSAWFRDRIEQEVGVMFSRQNATPLYSNPVLQTVVSTGWNRSMVWLSRQPIARERDPRVPPGLEKPHAASARIVEHWGQELPGVYAGMVDPSNASQPGNLGLQQMRADLFGAVAAFDVALRARLGEGHVLVLRASALRAALEDHPPASLESNHAV